MDGNGRDHVDAYFEYKELVGDDDGGTPFTPHEYVRMQCQHLSQPSAKKKNVAILYRKNNFFNRLLPFFPPSLLPLPPHPPQKHLLTKILHALHALRTLHTLHTHHATACRYEEYKRHKYPNGVPSFGRRAGGGAVPKKMTEAETMELYESKDGANPNPNPKPKP